jgi:hypothetical protein
MMRRCEVANPKFDWKDVVDWGIEELNGKSLLVVLGKLVVEAVVYHLWKQRNDIRHGNNLRPEQILQRIDWEIRNRIMRCEKFGNIAINRDLCCKWGLSDKILYC